MKFLKKFFSVVAIIIGLIVIFFVVIPNILYKEVTCTITKLTGETVEMNIDKVVNIISDDAITFENEYEGAKVWGVGEITEISKGSVIDNRNNIKGVEYYTVYIDNKIKVETRAEVFKDFKVGDKVRYEGVIDHGFMDLYVDQEEDSYYDPIQNIFHVEE